TAVLAGLRTASRHTDGGHTVLVAEIFIFGGSLLTGSRTFDESDHLFHIYGLHAHDLAYLCRHSRSSHRAGGNRCFSLCDSLCQSIAAGKSTAAAVVARQTFSYRNLLFIHRYFKLLGGDTKKNRNHKT